ncbi:MAG TPA: glycosyltransferase [bacterium]|nr:glycosyltransferase [bacterium]
MREFPHLVDVIGQSRSEAPPAQDRDASPRAPLKVCLVAPVDDGQGFAEDAVLGITTLADHLAGAGHLVTLLLPTADGTDSGAFAERMQRGKSRGIQVVLLPADTAFAVGAYANNGLSYRIFLWLRGQQFDTVHFADRGGYAYYSVLAKHQGLAFGNTAFVIDAYGPTLWAQAGGFLPLGGVEPIIADFMERQSLSLAQAVVASSQYLLSWLDRSGWRLPDHTYVATGAGTATPNGRPEDAPRPPREIVFAISWETDLALFCDALDRIGQLSRPDVTVMFLINTAGSQKEDMLRNVARRAKRWKWSVRTRACRTWADVGAYLVADGQIAVMGPSACGIPCHLSDFLATGTPLLVPAVAGIPELVSEVDRPRACFDPLPGHLADRLAQVAVAGMRSVRPGVSVDTNAHAWTKWHELLRPPLEGGGAAASPQPSSPLVTVCLTHHNRPRYLAQALASIRAQEYPNVEVVLVDDGSTDADAVDYVRQLESEFAARGWPLIRQENRFLGAARNTAVKHSRGKYLLFMDDDNYAKPGEIATFVTVAERTGAQILTCFADVFSGEDAPDATTRPSKRNVALGAALAFGVFHCGFGDANALVLRDACLRVGGFSEDYGVPGVDWEFFARAALAGTKLEVVPEALFWYRAHRRTITGSGRQREAHLRILRPYLDATGPELRSLLLYTTGQFLEDRYPKPARGLAQAFYLSRAIVAWARDSDRRMVSWLWRSFVATARESGLRSAVRAAIRAGQRRW